MLKSRFKNLHKTQKAALAALFIIGVFYSGFLFGRGDISVGSTQGRPASFNLFWRVWDLLGEKYDGELDHSKLIYGAISGLVKATGDDYSAFYTPEETEALQEDLSGNFEGIGAELTVKESKIMIVAPLSGSPAEQAGLKAGDEIIKIDGKEAIGLSLQEAVSKIRGPKGSTVNLTVQSGEEKSRDVKITRDTINVSSVKWSEKDGVGYIQLTRFAEDTYGLLQQAEAELTGKGITKYVIDLRNNPGGYLDVSVDVASEFMDSGAVVIEKNRKGLSKTKSAKPGGKLADSKYEILILVNEGSASASEIVAGAVKDNKRGTIAGEKTFGKGSVQELLNLDGGATLKITTARWYTPNGTNISEQGIEPDVKMVPLSEDESEGTDSQLDQALEYVRAR